MCCAMMFVAGRQNDAAAYGGHAGERAFRSASCARRAYIIGFGETTSFCRKADIMPQKGPCPSGQGAFAVHHSYNFPHCLPVKKRRVVVARNTLPARSTVEGNSGWEGLHG